MIEPLLACHGVVRRFGGVVALDALDLDLAPGEVLGLIGPNGSGKTTFFNVLTGLFPPDAGEIVFDGRRLDGLSPPRIHRAGIARTFQRSRLCLSLSIFDNLMIGDHLRLSQSLWFNLFQRQRLRDQVARHREEARALLSLFDPPLAARLDDPVRSVPMIDRRRIEICRALISKPRLLLLDEPSAGMTHDETLELMEDVLIARDRRGQDLSIVLIEHEMSAIERVTNRCVVLNYGKKLCEGSYQEVAADPRVRTAYLGLS